MNTIDSVHETTEREEALNEFFAAVRTAARESDAAVDAAKPALARLAAAVAGHDNSQALRIRSILLSLYTGGSVLADVSDLMTLDWPIRKGLCAVLLAFGHGEFDYEFMKSAFEISGDHGARWFLEAVHDPRERLNEALSFAKPGDCAPDLKRKGRRALSAQPFCGHPDRPAVLPARARRRPHQTRGGYSHRSVGAAVRLHRRGRGARAFRTTDVMAGTPVIAVLRVRSPTKRSDVAPRQRGHAIAASCRQRWIIPLLRPEPVTPNCDCYVFEIAASMCLDPPTVKLPARSAT